MDKSTARDLSKEIKAALLAVAAKHGLTVAVRGGSFDGGSFRPKVEFKEGDADKELFERYAAHFGFKPTDFGRTFKMASGKTFTIVGLNPGAPKRPVIIADSKGKRFRSTAPEIIAKLDTFGGIAPNDTVLQYGR